MTLGARDKCTTRAHRAARSRMCVWICFCCLKIVKLVCVRSSLASPHKTHLSCPDLIRASIHLRKEVLSKKMDHRVKPGDDDINWCDGHCDERNDAPIQH